MPLHHEHRHSPYSPEALFDLVMDIESYPEFLPWCHAARIIERQDKVVVADLVIRFKAFQERYRSRVSYDREMLKIDVTLVEGPFSYLHNHWRFEPDKERGGTIITFKIDFRFRSTLLEKLIGGLFGRAMSKLSHAFEERAKTLHSS